MNDDQPFKIHSATKVTLSPIARQWAREFNMTEVDMAKHLLQQEGVRRTEKPDDAEIL